MSDIERMISAILSKHNLSTESGRESAYEECVDYAESELHSDLRCNAFLRASAEMLEKDPVEYDVIRELVNIPDGAKLDIAFDDRHGFIVTANSPGLEYLSEILQKLAGAPAGEHIHLYNDEDPLTPISFNGLIFVEEDEWFEKALLEEDREGGEQASFQRPITPEDIFALQISGPIPTDIKLTRDLIYKVEGYSDNDMDESWKKTASGDAGRYVKFKITDDDGDDFEIILNLDDMEVNYFKKEDFAGLID